MVKKYGKNEGRLRREGEKRGGEKKWRPSFQAPLIEWLKLNKKKEKNLTGCNVQDLSFRETGKAAETAGYRVKWDGIKFLRKQSKTIW